MKTLNISKNGELVSTSVAAEILGISIDTVGNWDKRGILHSRRVNNKTHYFLVEELEEIKSSKQLTVKKGATYIFSLAMTALKLIYKPKAMIYRPTKQYLFSVSEAARFLGVSADTLRNWKERGKITPERTKGGSRRYYLKQLRQFLAPARALSF